MMAVTEEFTIKLPAKVADYVHRRVAEGPFESVSDYFENLMVSDMLEPVSEPALEQWMNTEGARRLAALHADPSSGLTMDQAFAGLLNEEEQFG